MRPACRRPTRPPAAYLRGRGGFRGSADEWILDEPWFLRVHDDSAWTELPPLIEPPD